MGQGLKLRFQGLDYMEIKLSEYNLPLNLIIEYISSRKSMHYTTKKSYKISLEYYFLFFMKYIL